MAKMHAGMHGLHEHGIGASSLFFQTSVAHSVAAAAVQDDTYWQVGLIQNTPTGQPAFLHRTSNSAKWMLDRELSSMQRPRSVTPPLGRHSMGGMHWNHEWHNVCFDKDRMVTDDQLGCKNVDLASMLLISQQDPDRHVSISSLLLGLGFRI